MSTTETVLVVAGVGLVGYLIWSHQHAAVVAPPSRAPSVAGGGIGNSLAQVGGAAVAQLGKDAGSWATSKLSSLFS